MTRPAEEVLQLFVNDNTSERGLACVVNLCWASSYSPFFQLSCSIDLTKQEKRFGGPFGIIVHWYCYHWSLDPNCYCGSCKAVMRREEHLTVVIAASLHPLVRRSCGSRRRTGPLGAPARRDVSPGKRSWSSEALEPKPMIIIEGHSGGS